MKASPHSQTNFLGLCCSLCWCKLLAVLKDLPQVGQIRLRTSKWTSSCRFNFVIFLSFFPHILHSTFASSVGCTWFRCRVNFPLVGKICPQIWHRWVAPCLKRWSLSATCPWVSLKCVLIALTSGSSSRQTEQVRWIFLCSCSSEVVPNLAPQL